MYTVVNALLYIILAILAVWYIYILVSNNRRTSYRWGRKKKIIEIIKAHSDIRARYTRQLDTIIEEMGLLFYKNGEIDYETMLDTLTVIKRNEYVDSSIVPAVDVIFDAIKGRNQFLHVSNASAVLFMNIKEKIKAGQFQEADSELELLYEKCVETEMSLKRRGRVEFWIGTAIGLVGILISCITGFRR